MKSEVTKQGLIYVEKKDIAEAVNTVLDLQNNADMLTENSSDAELKDAYHNHGIAHGYIRCLRDLGLLLEPNYTKLFIEQIRISEMISNLKEVNMVKGIVRKLDDLGRITLPREYRKSLHMRDREEIDMCLDGNIIRAEQAGEKPLGVVRSLDDLGRLTLPREYRRTLGIDTGDKADIYLDDGKICIQKYGCEWCIETEDLFEFNGHQLCRKCAYAVVDGVIGNDV